LTLPDFQRTIGSVPATFSEAYARVKQLVADFRANEKFCLSLSMKQLSLQIDFNKLRL